VDKLAERIGADLAGEILEADQSDEAGIFAQRERVGRLKAMLPSIDTPESRNLLTLADNLVKRSVWGFGGDGWAYDIGFGGLDHVLASGRNVNLLVLDTEVYSNTGGQMSKATPFGAVAKFAAAGKASNKKDLGMIAMSYGNVFVTQVALGANDNHAVRAMVEAESYDGPSLIIAYCHCIAHGINMRTGLNHHKMAVESGHWPLYRFDPRRTAQGLNPLQLDSAAPKIPIKDYMESENRFRTLGKTDPARAAILLKFAEQAVEARYREYSRRAQEPGAAQDGKTDKAERVAETAAS